MLIQFSKQLRRPAYITVLVRL